METYKDLKFAVLIDADNVPYANVKEMFEEIAKYGTPTFKRIYADWTKPTVSGWKNVLLENAITPIQQYSYSTGKNASDSALIIDAMDILYTGKVDGFCIVSSDSDFTRLATRLREAGMKVIGIGEKKTLNPFITACDKFIFFEVLKRLPESTAPAQAAVQDIPELQGLLTHAIKETLRDSGWASLSAVGSFITKTLSSFDPRNYGFTKLGELVRKQPYIELKEVGDGSSIVLHVRLRT